MEFKASSETETIKLGYDFAKKLKSGDVVCLIGDLGAGKTTFTKGIAQAFNSLYDPVSPTFNIVNEYPGDVNIYHFDLYRLKTIGDLYSIDIDSYLYSDGICVIEWPEISYPLLENYYTVEILKDNEGRTFKISENGGDAWKPLQ